MTGGARGIGRAIVEKFAGGGRALVVVLRRGPGAGLETRAASAAAGPVEFFKADVTREADVRRGVEQVLKSTAGSTCS